MKRLLISGVLFFVIYLWLSGPVQEHDSTSTPETITEEDQLTDFNSWPPLTHFQQQAASAAQHQFNGYTVTPLAEIQIRARVLAKENYYLGREADLSPTDLALGWGPMSRSEVVEQLTITQSGRWYRWQTLQGYPIERREIERNSANMHMIPANAQVAKQLKLVRVHDQVQISGYLVNVTANDGWGWQSSLTRDDTGNGACELIWVNALKRQ